MLILSKDWIQDLGRTPREGGRTMKFLTLIVTVLCMMFCSQNVFAQETSTASAAQSAPATPDQPADDAAPSDAAACQAGGTNCCDGWGTCRTNLQGQEAQCTDDIGRLVEACGGETETEVLATDCRARNSILAENECVCESGLQWNSEEKECCVANPAAYDRRRRMCEDSDGDYRCGGRNGWCWCPQGMELDAENGEECTGTALNRQGIRDLRARVQSLTEERDRLQRQVTQLTTDLATQREANETLRGQLDQTQQDLARVQQRLDTLIASLALQGVTVPDESPAGETAPGSTSGEIPGASQAVAAVAAEATQQSPLPPETAVAEEEEGWPEWAKWLLGIGIAGAVTAGTLIPLCEAGVICHTSLVQ